MARCNVVVIVVVVVIGGAMVAAVTAQVGLLKLQSGLWGNGRE